MLQIKMLLQSIPVVLSIAALLMFAYMKVQIKNGEVREAQLTTQLGMQVSAINRLNEDQVELTKVNTLLVEQAVQKSAAINRQAEQVANVTERINFAKRLESKRLTKLASLKNRLSKVALSKPKTLANIINLSNLKLFSEIEAISDYHTKDTGDIT